MSDLEPDHAKPSVPPRSSNAHLSSVPNIIITAPTPSTSPPSPLHALNKSKSSVTGPEKSKKRARSASIEDGEGSDAQSPRPLGPPSPRAFSTQVERNHSPPTSSVLLDNSRAASESPQPLRSILEPVRRSHRPHNPTAKKALLDDSRAASEPPRPLRSILKSEGRSQESRPKKRVRLSEDPDSSEGHQEHQTPLWLYEGEFEGPPPESAYVNGNVTRVELIMSADGKPRLKINFSALKVNTQNGTAQTPLPQSAARTPSIKLKLGKPGSTASLAPSASSEPRSKKPSKAVKGATPISAGKKRKQPEHDDEDDSGDELAKRPQPIRKLTIKTNPEKTPITPIIKLKHKGKIPKRPLGVGYDSELEDRELDPTILEGFIWRMMPGPDCDYLNGAIARGLVGLHRQQGGADVQITPLDRHGRRTVVTIRQRKYAASMVDLPCIVEGMKTWDKKAFIKSVDICQMLLVLGPIKTNEEAQDFPLPPDVDPKTFQYAHGLTPPMRWVRNRRFARTNRTQVGDIEAVERKVNALLEADAQAASVRSELITRDQIDQEDEQESSGVEYDDEEDAEGEMDDATLDDATPDDYFAARNGQHSEFVATPQYAETPEEEVGEEEVNALENLFGEDDDDEEMADQSHVHAGPSHGHLTALEGDSFAVTSTSASPSATAGRTPGSAAEDAEEESSEEESDEDGDTPGSIDDAAHEADEGQQQARDKIQELEEKIAEQKKQLQAQSNEILRRKIRARIATLMGDVEQVRSSAGLREED